MNSDLSISEAKLALTSAVERENIAEAQLWLRRLWKAVPSASLAAWTSRTICPILDRFCTSKARVAFLRSYTVEPAVKLLESQALTERIRITPWVGQFNTYSQEILSAKSDLYSFGPNVAVLSVLTRSCAPELWHSGLAMSQSERQGVVDRVCNELGVLFDQFRRHCDATMVVHSLEPPAQLADGIGDTARIDGQQHCIEQINTFLREEISRRSGFHLLDTGRLVARYGIDRWYDEQRWNSIRLPCSADAVPMLASEWLQLLGAIIGPPRKVLVVDLDNTLWHGILGEDGFNGIEMGGGSPHRSLQQTILNLYHRGILLAICSKNNHDEAWNVIQNHPDMLLQPQHFAAIQINWQDKATNIRKIAAELNVGLDSLVFLDDNPAEQHLVRTSIPEVQVLDVGSDATSYAEAVRRVVGFERIALTDDDQNRGRIYAEQRQRRDLRESSVSLESYLSSLETVLTVEELTPQTIERVAQLTQKTNQFNLTTKRYGTQQIQAFVESPASHVLAVRVTDRFGDNGIVGVAILHFVDISCEIDSFLLSCRVIGRGVETSVLSLIVKSAVNHGCTTIVGQYQPTLKNTPCAEFLPNHDFQERGDHWELTNFDSPRVQSPTWISIKPVEVTTED